MKYIDFILTFICSVILSFPIFYIFANILHLKWRYVLKREKLKVLEDITFLQASFYELKYKGKIQNFKIIPQQLEDTINVLSRTIENGDFQFKKIKIGKRTFNKEYFDALVEEYNKMDEELKELFDIKISIINRIAFIKNPVKYQVRKLLGDFSLHILTFIQKMLIKRKQKVKKEKKKDKLKNVEEKIEYDVIKMKDKRKEMYLA